MLGEIKGRRRRGRQRMRWLDGIIYSMDMGLDKEKHYIIIMRSLQGEDNNCTYIPNKGAPKYIRQMLTIIKLEIYSYIIIVEDINTQFTVMNR